MNKFKSQNYANVAELALKNTDKVKAEKLYRLAAVEEMKAIDSMDIKKTRTLGILVVSAASLWFKAKEYRQVEKVAFRWLATDLLPKFAVVELKLLIKKCPDRF